MKISELYSHRAARDAICIDVVGTIRLVSITESHKRELARDPQSG